MKNKIMKFIPALSILTALVLVVAFILEAAPFSNFYGKQTVRLYNELFFYNTSGTLKFSIANTGAVTMVGQSAVDSLTVAGESRLGGLVGYDQMVSVKNNAVNSNILTVYNSRNTLLTSVDSVGKLNTDSLTVDGSSWIGGLVDYLGRFAVKNGLLLYAQSWFNSRGTAIHRIDSVGVPIVPTVVADTSAFSTTLLTKAIYIPGALPTDIYAVSFRSLASGVSTDAFADSSTLGYFAKTDSLIVQRTGIGAVVSGSKFSYIRFRMD